MNRTILFLFLSLCFRIGTNAVTASHPCMLHTREDIQRVKSMLGESPWREAYQHLLQSKYAQSSWQESTANLTDGYLKRMDYANWGPNGCIAQYADYANYTSLMTDAAAAYQLALRYCLSGESRYADAAVRILNAWRRNCKGILRMEGYVNNIPDPNLYLINIQAYQMANAAELLRDYSGWAASDFTAFCNWMKTTYCSVARLFLDNHSGGPGTMHYWLNWDLANLTAVLSIGILCDDQEMIRYAVDYFKSNTAEAGSIRNAVPFLHQDPDSGELLGQCEESGRDQGHATLCVSLMGVFCQMALNIGEDLFAYDDYRALRMAEYVAKYNLISDAAYTLSTNASTAGLAADDFAYPHATFPYTAYTNPSYSNPVISADGRGTKRPCWELFYGYAQRHGVPAVYCGKWVHQMRQFNPYGSDGGAGDYGANSGGFDQLGYGTLMFARSDASDKAVSASSDTYVRKDNTRDHGSEQTMEIYTFQDGSAEADFVGLMQFPIPASTLPLRRAVLRLVTERVKGDAVMNVYRYGHAIDPKATYAQEASYILEARGHLLASFNAAGQRNKSIVYDAVDADFSDISSWTNEIDVTDAVSTTDGSVFAIMLAKPVNEKSATKFFSSEAASFANKADANLTFPASDLVPRLILSYGSETTGIGVQPAYPSVAVRSKRIYNLQGQRLQVISRPGIYIVDGRKVWHR